MRFGRSRCIKSCKTNQRILIHAIQMIAMHQIRWHTTFTRMISMEQNPASRKLASEERTGCVCNREIRVGVCTNMLCSGCGIRCTEIADCSFADELAAKMYTHIFHQKGTYKWHENRDIPSKPRSNMGNDVEKPRNQVEGGKKRNQENTHMPVDIEHNEN